MYGPYTGRHFASRRETDVEHMVATSEAHDSGLCAADAAHEAAIRLRPAEPDAGGARGEPAPEEREGRRGVAAAGEPVLVRGRVVAVKRKYRLTVDAREARALEGVLSRCASTAMMVAGGRDAAPSPEAPGPGEACALRRWDTNGNGRITCREARARHRPGAARSPGLALHARRRRGRRGVRVKARTGAHGRQQGNGGGDSWHSS